MPQDLVMATVPKVRQALLHLCKKKNLIKTVIYDFIQKKFTSYLEMKTNLNRQNDVLKTLFSGRVTQLPNLSLTRANPI
jgi:hypothetical protein